MQLPTDPQDLIVVKVTSIIDPSTCYINPQKELIDPITVGHTYKQIEKAMNRLQNLYDFIAANIEKYKLEDKPLIGMALF